MDNQPKIKKGSIVVVKEGRAFGNRPNTITKVLSRPGKYLDHSIKYTGKIYQPLGSEKRIIICMAPKYVAWDSTCNNKPAFYEMISDLRPATTEEKELFKKNNYEPFQISTQKREHRRKVDVSVKEDKVFTYTTWE